VLGGVPCKAACMAFFIYLFIYFFPYRRSHGALQGRMRVARNGKKNKLKFHLFFIYFLYLCFFFFRPSGLTPRTSAGLSHGSPLTTYVLTPTFYLLIPTSYLYYYIRLLMSLISLFFFALTFGKPLNYFTCEKEDF
jgi:hypothetical protein